MEKEKIFQKFFNSIFIFEENMPKNLFLSTAIIFSAFFVACTQPNPTPVNSTQHQNEKPKAAGEHSSANANGSVKTEEHNTTHREPMNTAETNHSGTNHSPTQVAPSPAANKSLPAHPQ